MEVVVAIRGGRKGMSQNTYEIVKMKEENVLSKIPLELVESISPHQKEYEKYFGPFLVERGIERWFEIKLRKPGQRPL